MTDESAEAPSPQAQDPEAPIAVTHQLTWTRAVFWILVLAFVAFQHRLWVGEGSYAEVWRLKTEIEKQEQENHLLGERNRRLAAEVKDLRDGRAAVEERARKQLGMIKSDETLYIINDQKK